MSEQISDLGNVSVDDTAGDNITIKLTVNRQKLNEALRAIAFGAITSIFSRGDKPTSPAGKPLNN